MDWNFLNCIRANGGEKFHAVPTSMSESIYTQWSVEISPGYSSEEMFSEFPWLKSMLDFVLFFLSKWLKSQQGTLKKMPKADETQETRKLQFWYTKVTTWFLRPHKVVHLWSSSEMTSFWRGRQHPFRDKILTHFNNNFSNHILTTKGNAHFCT